MPRSYPRRRISAPVRRAALVLTGAAIAGVAAGWSTTTPALLGKPTYPDQLANCRAVDGDTLRCGTERIRLIGIDAPELEGHCRPGRRCAPGDAYASTRSLGQALDAIMHVERVSEDHYGRTLAIVRASAGDLSCLQLKSGNAIYRADWDDGFRIARACPAATR